MESFYTPAKIFLAAWKFCFSRFLLTAWFWGFRLDWNILNAKMISTVNFDGSTIWHVNLIVCSRPWGLSQNKSCIHIIEHEIQIAAALVCWFLEALSVPPSIDMRTYGFTCPSAVLADRKKTSQTRCHHWWHKFVLGTNQKIMIWKCYFVFQMHEYHCFLFQDDHFKQVLDLISHHVKCKESILLETLLLYHLSALPWQSSHQYVSSKSYCVASKV